MANDDDDQKKNPADQPSSLDAEPPRCPVSSFSMAHALSIVRHRRDKQTKEVKSLEEIKKDRARAKRKRRRENQKLARARAKAQSDESGANECVDPNGNNKNMIESVDNLKKVSNECGEDQSNSPPPKKQRKPRAKKKAKTEVTFDDEAFKASLSKLFSMIPRSLMAKKKELPLHTDA